MNDKPKGRALTVIELVSEHFALASTILILTSAICATIFIYGYLRVFDWHLIWFVEYSDLLKAGLISIAFMSGIVYLLQTNIAVFIEINRSSGPSLIVYIVILAFGFAVWFGPQFYAAYEGTSGWSLPIAEVTATMTIMVVFVRGSQALRGTLSSSAMFEIFAMMFIFVASLGSSCGYYVRDSNSFDETIVLNEKIIDNVGLVFVTAGHSIFFARDKTIIVVPVGNVVEIRTQGSWK